MKPRLAALRALHEDSYVRIQAKHLIDLIETENALLERIETLRDAQDIVVVAEQPKPKLRAVE